MAILLIRHGETAGNRDRIIQLPDIPLSDRGLDQAARLGRRLARAPIAEIWSSHLRRAHQTAEAIERTTGIALALHTELEERNFGDLRGTPYAELRVDPFVPNYDPPGGEGWNAFHERVDRTWERIERHWYERFAGRDDGAHLAVVSHGLFLRSLLERRLLSAEQLERYGDGHGKITIHNTALSVVTPRPRIDGREPHSVDLLACTAHLEVEPETLDDSFGARPDPRISPRA
jgi:broad specificity phosphatase PhoE